MQIVLCNNFTATVSCVDFLPFPTCKGGFESAPLYTVPNVPSPMVLCKEMSSKRTSHGSQNSALDLKNVSKIQKLELLTKKLPTKKHTYIIYLVSCTWYIGNSPNKFTNTIIF